MDISTLHVRRVFHAPFPEEEHEASVIDAAELVHAVSFSALEMET